MHHSNQYGSLLSEDMPQRTPDDILFNNQVYQHHQGTRYRWSEQQSQIFQDYVQEFPNDYVWNINILLERLDLHGYGGIETKQGLDFEGKILIPKVLQKIINVVRDLEESNHRGNQRTLHNQNSYSSTQTDHRYPPWHISNPSEENTEPYLSYYNAVKIEDNEHPETTVPQSLLLDTQSPPSQDLHRIDELVGMVRLLQEQVNNIENTINAIADQVADALGLQ
ncbi:hypothetical protein F4813DRAFT_400540 [Daldinia decipiens]|uniref:uncharacterized protein n=1 Tax=Daldinia decipiens TaxID=326647 RepID=UPI0020C5969F|nr:uncharacterized protein F4813DRAFT_400540 [Daldinia decipiens]KAI1652914.1 hypothetical protein F4813DRAFT_400540 [Daldinia decipiens]